MAPAIGLSTLADTPLAVITADIHDAEWGRHSPARLADALDRQWTTMRDEFAALSADQLHVIAVRSDRPVQAPAGQPLVVIRAVQAVVLAAREHQRLPACQCLFNRHRSCHEDGAI